MRVVGLDMSKNREDRLFQDVTQRQRNTVFPDTAANEVRFWRNLFAGKQKLAFFQVVGVAVFALWALILTYIVFAQDGNEKGWRGYLSVLFGLLFASCILGGFVAAFHFSELRSRRRTRELGTVRKGARKKSL